MEIKPKVFLFNYSSVDSEAVIPFINFMKEHVDLRYVVKEEPLDLQDELCVINFFSKNTTDDIEFINDLSNYKDNQSLNILVDRNNLFYGLRLNPKEYGRTAADIVEHFKVKIDTRREPLVRKPKQDVDPERLRLIAQNFALKKVSRRILKDIVCDQSAILDLGCGDGSSLKMRLEGVLYGALYALDNDEKLIDIANKHNDNPKNVYRICNIERDLYITLGGKKFDIIILSSVLYLLDDPVSLLRTLRTYLKKDGCLIIQEMDDAKTRVFPERTFFKNAMKLWKNLEDAGDRRCGGKVQEYLENAGYRFVNKAIEGINLHHCDDGKYLWDTYFNYHLWKPLKNESEELMELYQSYRQGYRLNHDDYQQASINIELGFSFTIARP